MSGVRSVHFLRQLSHTITPNAKVLGFTKDAYMARFGRDPSQDGSPEFMLRLHDNTDVLLYPVIEGDLGVYEINWTEANAKLPSPSPSVVVGGPV